MKWFGLVMMTLDHINKYLLGGSYSALYCIGRSVFPLFAFVFAYNMARPPSFGSGKYLRACKHLCFFAVLATVPYMGLGGLLWGGWPLNILATFLASAIIMCLIEGGGRALIACAFAVFLVAGFLVEFWWPGIAMTVAAWLFIRRPSITALAIWVGATASLGVIPWLLVRVPISLSWAALAAFPIICLAALAKIRMPRLRWFFYAYYPVHLGIIWLVQR